MQKPATQQPLLLFHWQPLVRVGKQVPGQGISDTLCSTVASLWPLLDDWSNTRPQDTGDHYVQLPQHGQVPKETEQVDVLFTT